MYNSSWDSEMAIISSLKDYMLVLRVLCFVQCGLFLGQASGASAAARALPALQQHMHSCDGRLGALSGLPQEAARTEPCVQKTGCSCI